MKKLFFTLSLCLLLFSCNNDNTDDPNTFTLVGSINQVSVSDVQGVFVQTFDEVVLVARYHVPAGASSPSDFDDPDSRFMLRIPYDQKNMLIELPDNPPASLLRDIDNDFPEGLTISDPQAKTISFVEIGTCEAGSDRVEGQIKLYLRKEEGNDAVYHEVIYIYCDRPVTITGETQDWWTNPTTYELRLDKGWNMVVEGTTWIWSKKEQTRTVTNWMPSGMNWQYDMWLGGGRD